MYKINLFENLKSPQNPVTITIEDYVSYVKEGFNKRQVLKARTYGKGSTLYDRIKEDSYCVTHNFLFHGHKNDSNIISSTGLLYYDIDKPYDVESIDSSKIFIHHKSLGGSGNTIIIRASGITTGNFNYSYSAIADELGISSCMDLNAFKKTQFNVISYDPDIYYNPDAFIFRAKEKISFRGNMSSSLISPTNDSFFKNDTFSYRNTNASDYVADENEYQVFPEGILTAKINIPRNIPVGNRTKVLMAITQQMVALNPHLTYHQTMDKVLAVNNIVTLEPLDYKAVQGIVKSIMKYKKDGSINPINNKVRKVVFNANSTLSKDEKITIVNREVGKMRVAKTKQKIHDAILHWNKPEKITGLKIAKQSGVSIPTVNKYWREFKALAGDYNKAIKETLLRGNSVK